MDNTITIARLHGLGPLPDASTATVDSFLFLAFGDLVQQLTAPLSKAQAVKLINLGPPPDTGSLEVERALTHAVDLLSAEGI